MDSPAPRLSESNLRKLSRGLRSSKKSRTSVQSVLETQSVQDATLGGRSVSLSTLLPSGGGPGSVPRVDKLQSLEAKMASIEMSLGWRRRREALLETLPRAARDLVRELDTLHQTVREKENCIQGLRTQITNLGGTVVGANEGVNGVVSEAERKNIHERLTKVEAEIEAKKVAVKNLKLALDKIDITDNIDVRIQAAELEYELEREELNILNLKEESSVLNIRLQESCLVPPLAEDALVEEPKSRLSFQELLAVPGNAAIVAAVSLIYTSVSHTPGNPPFHVTFRPPLGCVIDWATDDTRLKKGDRIVEINGETVLGKNIDDVTKFMSTSSHLTLVVARPTDSQTTARKLEKQIEEKNKENRELLAKVEKIMKEKESIKNDNTRLNHRISYLEDQVNELQFTLQKAKDAAIITGSPNEVLTPSQPGATIIQVFQKGHQTLAVAGPDVETSEARVLDYPTLPKLKSTSCSSPDSGSNGPKGWIKTDSANGLDQDHDEDKSDDSLSSHPTFDVTSTPPVLPPVQTSSNAGPKLQPLGDTRSSPTQRDMKKVKGDENDSHSISVNCKTDPHFSHRICQKDEARDYDSIEKLRDLLTEKSPSYSYKSPSDFLDDSRGVRNGMGDYSKWKKRDTLQFNRSSSDDSPSSFRDSHLRKGETVEPFVDSRPSSQEESLSAHVNKIQCRETRSSRSIYGYDQPSRRVVSPVAEDPRPLRPRPVPPKKPERLSLQRTTSMQSVEDTRSCSRASSASTTSRSRLPRNGSNSSDERKSIALSNPDEDANCGAPPIPSPRNFSQNNHNKTFHHNIKSNHPNLLETGRLTFTSFDTSLHEDEASLLGNLQSPLNPSHSSQRLMHLSLNSIQLPHHPNHLPIDSVNSSRIPPYAPPRSPPLLVKSSPVVNGHRSCSRSKSSEPFFNLEASLGLEVHEEVRAQPLYEYLRQTHDPALSVNHHISRHDKGGFDAPPTPSTPPRGINLSIKNSVGDREEWC